MWSLSTFIQDLELINWLRLCDHSKSEVKLNFDWINSKTERVCRARPSSRSAEVSLQYSRLTTLLAPVLLTSKLGSAVIANTGGHTVSFFSLTSFKKESTACWSLVARLSSSNKHSTRSKLRTSPDSRQSSNNNNNTTTTNNNNNNNNNNNTQQQHQVEDLALNKTLCGACKGVNPN